MNSILKEQKGERGKQKEAGGRGTLIKDKIDTQIIFHF